MQETRDFFFAHNDRSRPMFILTVTPIADCDKVIFTPPYFHHLQSLKLTLISLVGIFLLFI
jgi:hypothetical protein